MVLICLRFEQFAPKSFTKPHAWRVGPFKVTKRLGPNVYVIKLPFDYGIGSIFKVEDLTQFHGSKEQMPTTTNLPIQQDAIIRASKNAIPKDDIISILDY